MTEPAKEELQPWYRRRLVIVVGLLSLGPLALPLVWMHPKIKWYYKIYISIAVAGLTWACLVLADVMLEHLKDQMEILEELYE